MDKTFGAYDLMHRPQTAEDIYNWAVEEVATHGKEYTVASLLLERYWGPDRMIPNQHAYYTITPITFDRDTGTMTVAMRRNTRMSPRDEKPDKLRKRNEAAKKSGRYPWKSSNVSDEAVDAVMQEAAQ